MQTDPTLVVLQYLMTRLKARFAAVRSGELDRGALSLEWVAIAFVLVAAAIGLATFLTGKLHTMEGHIQNP
jgi:hypothetical protein